MPLGAEQSSRASLPRKRGSAQGQPAVVTCAATPARAVRIIPIRKDSARRDVGLRAILEAVENSPLKQPQEAIKARDREKVVAAYKFTLEGCYSCHKASEKPYLRRRIPER